MSGSSVLKVLLVDDDPIVPQYESQMLVGAFGSVSCDIATTIWEGKEKLRSSSCKYDLILLDLLLPDGSGTEILDFLKYEKKHHETPVLITSGLNDPVTASECRFSGAKGYISRLDLPNLLITAVKFVLSGQEFFPALTELSAIRNNGVSAELTPQMSAIADALGASKSIRDVSTTLGIPESTVKNALPDLMRFYGVATRGELLRRLASLHTDSN